MLRFSNFPRNSNSRNFPRKIPARTSFLRKSWRVFHDKFLIGRCFCGFILPVLDYCSEVWCSAADTHLKLLHRVVSGACFLAGGVLNCDLSHRRYVAVLCMLYKIKCNPKHPLGGALPVPLCQSVIHALLWSHIGILLRLLAAEPRSTAGLLFLSQYLSGMIWLTPYLMVWDWRVSRAGPMPFWWPSFSLLFCLQLFSLFLVFLYRLDVWCWGLRTDKVSISLSQPCIAHLLLLLLNEVGNARLGEID